MGKLFLHGRAHERTNDTPYAKLTVNCPAGLVVLAESNDSSLVLKTTSGSDNKAVFETIPEGSWTITFEGIECPPRMVVEIDVLDYEITLNYTMATRATVNFIYPIGTILGVNRPHMDGDGYITFYDPSGVTTEQFDVYGTYKVRWYYYKNDPTYPPPPDPETFEITEDGQVLDVIVSPGRIPIFEYTDRCYVYDDNGIGITSSPDNWKIGFSTSGTFKFILPNGASDGIDIWLLRGYDDDLYPDAVEAKKVQIEAGKEYEIIVGAPGGQSSAFGYTADLYSADTGLTYGYIEICNTRYANINVSYTEGATCTCSNGVDTYMAPDTSGSWVATVPLGDWTITSSDDTHDPVSVNVSVTSVSQVENVNVRFFEKAYINIVYPSGARCAYQSSTGSGGTSVVYAPDTSGSWFVTVYRVGMYIVVILDDTNTPIAYKSVNITSDGQIENVTLEFEE